LKKPNSKQQLGLNLVSWHIVKNAWGDEWHIQDSNGFELPGQPCRFGSPDEAASYAEFRGIKIGKGKNE
jgi:hypothetical protein